ncbi:MAG: hypothetical protein WAU01_13805, partial [Saprospiraceae bacterium]
MVGGLLMLTSITYIGYHVGQSDFNELFISMSIGFLGWLMVISSGISATKIIIFGVLLRLCLVFAFPLLSDDIFRFYWDGTLTHHGLSPYGNLPTEVLKFGIPSLNQELFSVLNSPNYYTIYPPVSQLYYAVSAWFGDVFVFSIVLKSLFIITETSGAIIIVTLLKKLQLPLTLIGLYFIHPLVLI